MKTEVSSMHVSHYCMNTMLAVVFRPLTMFELNKTNGYVTITTQRLGLSALLIFRDSSARTEVE